MPRKYRIKSYRTYKTNITKKVKKTSAKRRKKNKAWKWFKKANDPKEKLKLARRPKTQKLLQATEMALLSTMLFGTPEGAFGAYVPEAVGADEVGQLIMRSAYPPKPMTYGFP